MDRDVSYTRKRMVRMLGVLENITKVFTVAHVIAGVMMAFLIDTMSYNLPGVITCILFCALISAVLGLCTVEVHERRRCWMTEAITCASCAKYRRCLDRTRGYPCSLFTDHEEYYDDRVPRCRRHDDEGLAEKHIA